MNFSIVLAQQQFRKESIIGFDYIFSPENEKKKKKETKLNKKIRIKIDVRLRVKRTKKEVNWVKNGVKLKAKFEWPQYYGQISLGD